MRDSKGTKHDAHIREMKIYMRGAYVAATIGAIGTFGTMGVSQLAQSKAENVPSVLHPLHRWTQQEDNKTYWEPGGGAMQSVALIFWPLAALGTVTSFVMAQHVRGFQKARDDDSAPSSPTP